MKQPHRTEKKIFSLKDRGGDLSKEWYIEYRDKGKRIRKYFTINQGKTVEERKKLANKYLRKLRKEAKQVPANINERELIYQALENERPYLRKKSFQTYKSKLDRLFNWLGADELTTESLRLYFKLYREHHPQMATYNVRRQIGTFFKKAGLIQLIEPIKIKKGPQQPLRYFQVHQCQQLLNYLKHTDPKLWLHCNFIYFTAIRPRSELLKIRTDDIFFDDRKIAVRGEIAKNKKTEFVRIAPNFYPIIEHLKYRPPGTYIFPSKKDDYKPAGHNTYGDRFRKVLDHFGYGRQYQLYSWKHTGAIAVYKATKNIMALRDHCRHSDVATTQLYLRQLGLDDYDDFYDNFPAPTEWR